MSSQSTAVSSDLASFPLLAELPEPDACTLAGAFEWLAVEPGRVLFREGDAADALWLVLEGRVGLESSRSARAGECGPGQALGALSLVERGARESSARTLSRCRLLRLHHSAYEHLVATAPGTACRLMEAIARECAVSLRGALAALEDAPVG